MNRGSNPCRGANHLRIKYLRTRLGRDSTNLRTVLGTKGPAILVCRNAKCLQMNGMLINAGIDSYMDSMLRRSQTSIRQNCKYSRGDATHGPQSAQPAQANTERHLLPHCRLQLAGARFALSGARGDAGQLCPFQFVSVLSGGHRHWRRLSPQVDSQMTLFLQAPSTVHCTVDSESEQGN